MKKLNEISINAKKRNIKNAVEIYTKKRKGFNGIKTFGVLTSENPDSIKASNKDNKESLKTLSNYLKSANYVFVKQKGYFAGNIENSYFIFNIGIDTLKYYAGLFEQTSFIYGELKKDEVISYYYEKEFKDKKYSKKLNPYIEKDKTNTYVDATESLDYSIIGKNFKYRLPFSIFESVNNNIYNNLKESMSISEMNSIIDFTIKSVGETPYNYRKKIYGDMLVESSFNRLLHWIEKYEITMITAFRGRKENILHPNLTKNDDKLEGDRYNRRENKERNRELAATLLRLGYGITKISGVYVENFGMPNSRLSEEESFLVVNKNDDEEFFDKIFKLSEYYNQDCFCYKAKGDNVGYNVGTNGADYPGYGEKSRNGKFVAGVKNEFMSRLKNNGFAFTDEDDLDKFSTSHDERKRERNNRRLENGLNEQFETFNDYGMGAKQSIHNISKEVIKYLKK